MLSHAWLLNILLALDSAMAPGPAVLLGAGLRVEHIHRLGILNVSTLPQQHIDTKSNQLNLIHSHNQSLVHESNHGSSAALGPCHADTSTAGEQGSVRGLGGAQLHLVGSSLGKTSSCNLREIRNFEKSQHPKSNWQPVMTHFGNGKFFSEF